MKTLLRCFAVTACLSVAIHLAAAADLAPADKDFLTKYEPVRAALAADDLAGARKAAASLSDPDAKKIAAADNLAAARSGFAGLSVKAAKLAATTAGYYVIHCPMVNKDWVQPNKEVSNPYEGKEMLTCGVVRN